jgi:phospholipid N-methyltransferase
MHQEWADYRVFWREFRCAFHTTGAILPSGRALSRALTRYVREPGEAAASTCAHRRILEVGPGTGAVTAQIVRDLRPHDWLTLVERNDQFVARLRQRIDSDKVFQSAAKCIELIHAGIEEISEVEPYHVIVSGLPFNNFTVSFVEQIIGKLGRLLTPQGTLSFFEYIAVRPLKALVSQRAERDRLRGIERVLQNMLIRHEITRDRVLTNFPPAWVHHVRIG